MELHDLVRHEWHDEGVLSRRSLIWIDEHADPGDANPICTAIAQLRRESADTSLTTSEPPSFRAAGTSG